ncbi:hypothetical protein ACIGW1_05360 [Streptomyces sp. NPDC053780]|uniref:hypothetical protein n=1 Tax=unclassified Streptomyces TaxID=2593676 RepID=UPI003415AD1C
MLREVRHEKLLAVFGGEGVPPVRRLLPDASDVLRDGSVLDSTHEEVPVERATTDALITDDTSDPATLAAFRDAGTEVITV